MKKICKQCGAEFETTVRQKRYCSRKCKARWQYERTTEERTCVVCGKVFTIYKHRHTHTRSIACGALLREKFDVQKMTCLYCGREYEGHNRGRNKFCCRRCSELYKIKQRADNPEQTAAKNAAARAAYHANDEPRQCAFCGESFMPKDKRHIYCSKKCKSKALWQKRKPPALAPIKCVCCGESFVPRNAR